MNNSSENQNVVKDARKLSSALDKHMRDNCEHCKRLARDAFGKEEYRHTKEELGNPPEFQTQRTPYRTKVDLI